LGVEGFEVDRGAAGELFDLTFADTLSGAALDGFHGPVEGAPGALDRGQVSQSVGVLLSRQVQHPIGGVQVRRTALMAQPVGDPADLDVAEDGGQAALMPRFGARSG